MEKKYELTEETLEVDGHILHRIMALRDFGEIKKGSLGGWIENEDNLTHCSNCWVYDNAAVCGNARIDGNAKVFGNARIDGNAKVFGNARICDNALVCDNAKISGSATVFRNAKIGGDAEVFGCAQVLGNTKVYNSARVYGGVIVCDKARVFGDVQACGSVKICGNAIIKGNAVIKDKFDYIVFKDWWSRRFFTWTRSNNMWSAGCFYSTGEELIKKAYDDSDEKGRDYENVVKYVELINKNYKNEKVHY